MMTNWRWFGVGAMIVAAGAAWAMPFRQDDVSGNARWLAHIDVAALVETDLGQTLLDRFDDGLVGRRVDAFAAVFGFDPRDDLDAVTLYGASQEPDAAVMIVQGRFDAERLITLLRANDTYQPVAYLNSQLHSWIDADRAAEGRRYAAFQEPGRLVIGRGEAEIKEALDVLNGRRAGLDGNQVFGVSLPENAPVLLAVADLSGMSRLSPRAAVLRSVTSAQLVMNEGDGQVLGLLKLVSIDADAARQLQAVGQGFLALGMMSGADRPWLLTLIDGLNIDSTDNVLRLDLRLSVQDVMRVVDDALARRTDVPGQR